VVRSVRILHLFCRIRSSVKSFPIHQNSLSIATIASNRIPSYICLTIFPRIAFAGCRLCTHLSRLFVTRIPLRLHVYHLHLAHLFRHLYLFSKRTMSVTSFHATYHSYIPFASTRTLERLYIHVQHVDQHYHQSPGLPITLYPSIHTMGLFLCISPFRLIFVFFSFLDIYSLGHCQCT